MKTTIDTILARVLVALMGLMVVDVLWQVASRFLLKAPSSFTEELARYLLIWIGLLGAAYASGQKNHLSINLLSEKLKPQGRLRLEQVQCIIIILFALAALVIGGSRLVYVTYILQQSSPALQLPLAAVYLVLPLSGLLVMYYKILELRAPKTTP